MKLKHKLIRDKIVKHFTDRKFTTDEAMRIVKKRAHCPSHTGLSQLLHLDKRVEKVGFGKVTEWKIKEGLI